MSRGCSLLLGLTATLGGLCLVWTLLTTVGGLTPLVVLSGSMSPSIETGALAVSREVPAAAQRVGLHAPHRRVHGLPQLPAPTLVDPSFAGGGTASCGD